MGLNIGSGELDALMVGTGEVSAVMLGSTELWSGVKGDRLFLSSSTYTPLTLREVNKENGAAISTLTLPNVFTEFTDLGAMGKRIFVNGNVNGTRYSICEANVKNGAILGSHANNFRAVGGSKDVLNATIGGNLSIINPDNYATIYQNSAYTPGARGYDGLADGTMWGLNFEPENPVKFPILNSTTVPSVGSTSSYNNYQYFGGVRTRLFATKSDTVLCEVNPTTAALIATYTVTKHGYKLCGLK